MARRQGPASNRRSSAESSRGPLWMWPTGMSLVGVVTAEALGATALGPSWWPGDLDGARSSHQLVATSVMTATTLTFSLTVLAQQLASQQFSPRLLREFTRDPTTKWVLAVLSASFAFSAVSLRHLGSDATLPGVAATVTVLLGLASLLAILAFITHIVKVLRVDTMMRMVHADAEQAIDSFYPPYGETERRSPADLDLLPDAGTTILADRSGFLQMTDVEVLVERARAHDAVVGVLVRAGDHVVLGTPVARVWLASRVTGQRAELDELAAAIRRALATGYERTIDQDASYGFRELEDIAVKAVSPAINDPVTAAHAVGHMAHLLVRLTGCRLGPTVHEDEAGTARVVVPDRDLRYYLDLACGQLRRFGRSEPTVLLALLRMLRDVALSCRDDHQRDEVRRAADQVVAELDASVAKDDADGVRDLRSRVEHALACDVDAAYDDRAGETRSL